MLIKCWKILNAVSRTFYKITKITMYYLLEKQSFAYQYKKII